MKFFQKNPAILALQLGALLAITSSLSAQYGQLPPHLDVSTLKRATPSVTKGAPVATQATTVVGSGPNYATFVVSFNDGFTTTSDTLTWGYRWSGSASAGDLLNAVSAADPAFFDFQGSAGSLGVPLYGLAYDADGDLDPDVSFFNFGPNGRQPAPSAGPGSLQVTGPWSDSNADSNSANDPDDFYQSGWLSDGFWAFYTSTNGTVWNSSFVALGSYTLQEGDYIGLSFWPGFSEVLPGVAAPVTINQLPSLAYNGGTTLDLNTPSNTVIIVFGFNEAVQGVDVNDLLLSGSASKSASKTTAVDSVTFLNPTTVQFVVSDVQVGTLNYTLAPNAGDIQDLQGNNLSTQTGSFAVVAASDVSDWALFQ